MEHKKKIKELTFEDTRSLVQSCTNGQAASCSFACPFNLDVRSFADKCARGKWLPAYKALRNEVLFPVIVSHLCDAPCLLSCQRSKLGDGAINLPALERATVTHTKERPPNSFVIPPRTETLAIVGAGMTGLSLALVMAQKKYNVTVFDSAEGWGGRLRGLSDWPVYDEDITRQFSVVTVDFKFGSKISSLDELSKYDAIYITTGSGGDDFGLLPDYDKIRQTTANSRVFLGGELCGTTLMEGIAQAAALSRLLEAFLQTGSLTQVTHEEMHEPCENYPAIFRAERSEAVPEGADGYSKEQAQQEGARCMQCDCAECMLSCELLDTYKKKPEKIAIEVYTDTKASPPIATHAITRQTYSCNQCGHCKAVCPENISMGELFSMSRQQRMQSGDAPLALSDFWLREMDFHITEGAFAAAAGDCDYLFFPGCQLGAYNPVHVLKSYEFLAARYKTGVYLNCCGAPALWARDDERFYDNLEKIRGTVSGFGSPRLVFACATCESIFAEYLPEIERVSLYELLAEDAGLSAATLFPKASIFDPCAARENTTMQNGVRELLRQSGTELSELPEKNRCCGYGGNIQLANPKLFDKIVTNRAEQSDDPYIVYCANCRAVFQSRDKECAHVLDIAFGLTSSAEQKLPNAELPKIAERRENSRTVKSAMSQSLTGTAFVPERPEWHGLELEMSPELIAAADEKLISTDDIKEAIFTAETTGDRFLSGDGTVQCCLVRSVFTYWVRYKKQNDGKFEIFEAYNHRMSFSRDM